MHNRIELAKEFAKSIKSFDITLIILFGSVARGDDTEESDIDILIVSPVADKIKPEIHKIAIDIILEKDEVISPRLMTEEQFNKTNDYPFLQNVLKEGVVMDKIKDGLNVGKSQLISRKILLENGQYRDSVVLLCHVFFCFSIIVKKG